MKKYAIPKFNIKDNEDEFYLIEDHSGECQLENIPKKEIKKNTKNFYKLTNLKNDLTNYLNSNDLTKFKAFKKFAEAQLIKLNLNVMSGAFQNFAQRCPGPDWPRKKFKVGTLYKKIRIYFCSGSYLVFFWANLVLGRAGQSFGTFPLCPMKIFIRIYFILGKKTILCSSGILFLTVTKQN